jgi:hypothetical protein
MLATQVYIEKHEATLLSSAGGQNRLEEAIWEVKN